VFVEEAAPYKGKRRAKKNGGAQNLEQRVAEIFNLDPAGLQESWQEAFGAAPPPNLSRAFMTRALAYQIQENARGALKPATLRILDRAAVDKSPIEARSVRTRRAAPGTVLLRHWHGVPHRVTVLDKDVVYRGHRYKSLSEVARLITGTCWSGPMFFGLRSRKQEKANG
jgi:DUF2924 family protein